MANDRKTNPISDFFNGLRRLGDKNSESPDNNPSTLQSRKRVVNNQLISDKMYEALKESVDFFSAKPYFRCAGYIKIVLPPKSYNRLWVRFGTPAASVVDRFMNEICSNPDYSEMTGLSLCFEVAADPTKDAEDQTSEPEVEFLAEVPEKLMRKGAGTDGEVTATIETGKDENGILYYKYKRLKDPIIEGNRVYFELVLIEAGKDAPRQADTRKAVAVIKGEGDASFISQTGKLSGTKSMFGDTLSVGGRNSAPGKSVDARIDSDKVAQLHFVLHHRNGSFYIEPWARTMLNGSELNLDSRPWAPVRKNDRIGLPDAGLVFTFSPV